jgi:hypothetical protein
MNIQSNVRLSNDVFGLTLTSRVFRSASAEVILLA